MLKGKRLSILGDSVSTYNGVSNNPQVNNTLASNPTYYYKRHFPVESAYWHVVLDAFGMELCVNNSYSGGNLSGKDNPLSGMGRANHLSKNTGESPDLIILFMGLNDLGRNVPPEEFQACYTHTLSVIKEKYPDPRVCCVNMPDRFGFLLDRTLAINGAIEAAVKKAGEGFFIAPLFDYKFSDYDDYYFCTLDGLHPNFKGMEIIAEVIIRAIRENL